MAARDVSRSTGLPTALPAATRHHAPGIAPSTGSTAGNLVWRVEGPCLLIPVLPGLKRKRCMHQGSLFVRKLPHTDA